MKQLETASQFIAYYGFYTFFRVKLSVKLPFWRAAKQQQISTGQVPRFPHCIGMVFCLAFRRDCLLNIFWKGPRPAHRRRGKTSQNVGFMGKSGANNGIYHIYLSIYLSICLSIYLSVCVFVCIIWHECMYTNSLYKLRLIERALRAVWAFAEIYWDLQESFFSVRVQDEMLMYMPAARSAKFSFIFGKSRLAMAKP